MKKSKIYLILLFLVLSSTYFFSNELIIPNNINNNNSDLRSSDGVFNTYNKNNISPFAFSFNSLEERNFMRMGINGIIFTTVGLCIGTPVIILEILLKQYYDSLTSDNIIETIFQVIIIKPLIAFSLVLGLIVIAISGTLFIIGLIFMPVGFANYAKHRKANTTSFFIDSKNDNINVGFEIKI